MFQFTLVAKMLCMAFLAIAFIGCNSGGTKNQKPEAKKASQQSPIKRQDQEPKVPRRNEVNKPAQPKETGYRIAPKEVAKFTLSEKPIRPLRTLLFGEDGTTLFMFLEKQPRRYVIERWSTLHPKKISKPTASFFGEVLSPDGAILASTFFVTRKIQLHDSATGKETARLEEAGGPLPGRVTKLTFSKDGSILVAVIVIPGKKFGDEKSDVVVWDMKTKTVRAKLQRNAEVARVFVSPNGKTIGLVKGAPPIAVDGVEIWDVASGKTTTLFDQQNAVTKPSISFTNDGKKLALSYFRIVKVLETASGKEIANLDYQAPIDSFEQIAEARISPDGKRVAAVTGRSSKMLFWDIGQQSLVGKIEGIPKNIHSLDFSLDGRYLVAASFEDRIIVIWDLFPDGKIP